MRDVGHQLAGLMPISCSISSSSTYLAGQIADAELGAASADGRGQHDAGLHVKRGSPAVDPRWTRLLTLETSPDASREDTRAATAVGTAR